MTTSHTHSTYAHIYAQAHSFHVQLGSTVVKSIFCFKSRPAEVLLCRIKNTFVNTVEIAACQDTFTRVQETWIHVATLTRHNWSKTLEQELLVPKPLDCFSVTATLLLETKHQELRVQSPSPSQFSQIKNVIHVQEKKVIFILGTKTSMAELCTCFYANIKDKKLTRCLHDKECGDNYHASTHQIDKNDLVHWTNLSN